jgi:hypothetical protein
MLPLFDLFFHNEHHTIFIYTTRRAPFLLSWLHPLGRGPPPGVPSRDSNSGLLYSKPMRYNLSHTAPYLSHTAPYLSHTAPFWATPHPTEPHRTLSEPHRTPLSHTAPSWATPHPEPHRTLIWATPHFLFTISFSWQRSGSRLNANELSCSKVMFCRSHKEILSVHSMVMVQRDDNLIL